MMKNKQKTFYRNKIVTKKYLKEILFWSFKNYGMARAGFLADSLKNLGFHFATQAGISISIEDLKVPLLKTEYIEKADLNLKKTEIASKSGEITEVERYQQLTDNWNMTSEKLKDQVVNFLKEYDPLNPIYIMAFSGARGNLSQVRQLVGIRGLMADPSGDVIAIPITKNFREGLSITDYMISAYGARKGLVDTALKTADSGYLTRRLIDVAQDILIRETDCYTKQGIFLFKIDNKNGKIISLKDRILGRINAKDIIDPKSNKLIAKKNQQINALIAKKIEELNLSRVFVRSPLTCQLSRSICKNCYGWNLSNGKLVDLGEAIGIIAAQSIGEPGTQLTMRTFHTGGIFSADSNYQIFSKVSGQIFFPSDLKTFPTRTEQGKNGLIIELATKIEIVNFKNVVTNIFLNKDTILFVRNKEFIRKDQIIASLSQTLQNSEKRGKKVLSAKISGEIFFNDKMDLVNSKNNFSKKVGNRIIWILSGTVINVPFYIKITKYKFSSLNNLTNLGLTKLVSYKSGLIKISNKDNNYQVKLLIENSTIENCELYNSSNENRILNKNYKYLSLLKIKEKKFFHLTHQLKFNIEKNLSLGKLININFKTKLSGITYFLKLKKNSLIRKSKTYDINQGGGICFLPEETLLVNKDISSIFIQNGSWVEINTELAKDVYNKTPGFVEIIFTNNIVNKINIKSGYCISLKDSQIDVNLHKKLFFKGEKLFDTHQINQPTYTEIIKNNNTSFLLLRPVFLYELPKIKQEKKDFLLKNSSISFGEFNYTYLKNKDRININSGSINLVETDLILLNNTKNSNDFIVEISFTKKQKNNLNLECNIFENIFSKFDLPKQIDLSLLNIIFYIKNNQYIEPYTIIGDLEFLTNLKGKINNLKERKQAKFRRILIILPTNYKTIFKENKNKILLRKNFINSGNYLYGNLLTLDSGFLKKNNNKLKIHLASSFLFSKAAEIFWYKNDFIKENETLAISFYKLAQTADIIQGLPKIEEILEARRSKVLFKINNNPGLVLNTSEGKLNYINKFGIYTYSLVDEQDIYINNDFFSNIGQPFNELKSNPHHRLRYLNFSYKKFLTPYKAAYKSLRKIQSSLLNIVQSVYFSQGVNISEKHFEIIIKQMTSKIKVKNRGGSGILSGEYIDLQQVENMNKVLKKTNAQEIIYEPALLGITKASLTTESFISSSSFQETVRILSNSAIQGKVDWLRGLKENVIIGRLIPAGTGFNSYEHISHLNIRLPKILIN